MEKLALNLKNLLDKTQLGENELARRTGIPQPMIHRILSGENRNPKIATLMPIANYFMVSLSQLIGDEPMEKDIKVSTSHPGWNEIPLFDWETLYQALSGHVMPESSKKIPVDLEAGPDCFATILKNRDMEPRFQAGNILIFDKNRKMENGFFGLFHLHDEKEIVFRQVLFKRDQYYLKCLNPESDCFSPVLLNANDKLLALLIQSRSDH